MRVLAKKRKLGLDFFDFSKARSLYARLVLCFFLSSHDSLEGFLEVRSKGGSAVDSGGRCFYLLRPTGFHRL